LSTGASAAAYDDFVNAAKNGNVREINNLLRRGMDPNTVDPTGQPVLHLAARDGSLEVIKALVKAKADVNKRNAAGETAIMLAAIKGDAPIVEFLIAEDAQINHPGWTPLIYAATAGHDKLVKLFIENHAYIDGTSPNGTTALMMAVRGGFTNTVKLLLDEDADPNVKNDLGDSALSWAERAQNRAMIEMIKAKVKK
jgi:uncharacterized protein